MRPNPTAEQRDALQAELARPREASTVTTEALIDVVRAHLPDGFGHCERCGEEWVCPAYLRAMSALRQRGVVRPLPEGP